MNVETILEAQDRASGPMHEVARSSERTAESVGKLQEHFDELREGIRSVSEMVGVGFGIREMGEMFVGSAAKTEEATRSLAAVTSGMFRFRDAAGTLLPVGMKNFHAAFDAAREQMERFEQTAMRTGLSVEGLAQTSTLLSAGVGRAGGTTRDLEGLTKQVAMLGKVYGQSAQESAAAVQEFIQIGLVSRSNPLLAGLSTGGRHGGFGMMSAAQRLKIVTGYLSKLHVDEQMLHESETLNDKWNRIKDTIEIIGERAGKPLFERVAKAAEKLAEWLDKNHDKLVEIEDTIVQKLLRVFDKVVTAAKYLDGHLGEIKSTVEDIVVAWAGFKVGKTVSDLAEGLAGAAKNFGAEAGNDFGSVIGRLGVWGEVGGMVALGLEHAIHAGWLDKILGIKVEGVKTAGDYATQRARLEKQNKLVDAYMEDYMAGPGAKDLSFMRKRYGFDKKTAMEMYLGTLEQHANEHSMGGERGMMIGGEGIKAWWLRKAATVTPPASKKPLTGYGIPSFNNNFYNARFDIMQQFAPGFDPDRVAVAFTSDLAQLADKRMQSNHMPAFTGS